MKQKNMILVVVAVGCGLVAAFLTANMSARPKTAAVDMIDIPCAAKDLSVGTKLTKDEMSKLVTTKKVPKDQAPPMYVATIEELADKRVTRTLRPGDTFNPADLTVNGFLNPPPGHSVMTVRCSVDEAVAGFIGPGARVDVIASVQLRKSQRWMVFPLFQDILVLAVDSNSAPTQTGGAFASLSMVSFAVNAETSLLLQGAVSSGAMMRLALRHQEDPTIYKEKLSTEEIWDIFSGRVEEKKEKVPEPAKPVLVKVKVPTVDLPVGTELSESVIVAKFKDTEFPEGFVPEGAVTDLKKFTGKYLVRELSANFFVPQSSIGEKPSDKPKTVVPKVAEAPAKPKPVYMDVTVQTANGTKKFRYLKKDDGEYHAIGEVPANLPPSTERKREPKPSDDEPADEKPPEDKKKEESDPQATPKVTLAN